MGTLSEQDVRRIARLCKLSLSDAEVADAQQRLASVIQHFECLERLDLEGVDPMPHAHDEPARLADDEPGTALPPETLVAIAPALFKIETIEGGQTTTQRYIVVPRVLGEGGGA